MQAERQREYAYDNARAAQAERLRALETLFAEGTIAELEARGVGGGWRGLVVGAGGGSIALWLADRVGSDGAVLATDLDTTVLAGLSHPRLEVRVHDVLADQLPAGAFDLVHARLLLAWLPDPRAAIARLIDALAPGGWLLVEELDFASAVPDPRMGPELGERFERMVAAHHAVIAERHGFDPHYARRLAGDLADAGLTASGCRGRASMWRAGEAGGEIWRLSFEQLRDGILAMGLMDAAEADAAIELCTDPRFSTLSPIMMAAWGRRPLVES
jgi:SAM-dependent methyltransferase